MFDMRCVFIFIALFCLRIVPIFANPINGITNVRIVELSVFGDVAVSYKDQTFVGGDAWSILAECNDNPEFMSDLKKMSRAGDNDSEALLAAIALFIFPKEERAQVCLNYVVSPKHNDSEDTAIVRAMKWMAYVCVHGEMNNCYSGFPDDKPVIAASKMQCLSSDNLKTVLFKIRSAPIGQCDELNFFLDAYSPFVKSIIPESATKFDERIRVLKRNTPFPFDKYAKLIPSFNFARNVPSENVEFVTKELADDYFEIAISFHRNILARKQKDFEEAAYYAYLKYRRFAFESAWTDKQRYMNDMSLLPYLFVDAEEATIFYEMLKAKHKNIIETKIVDLSIVEKALAGEQKSMTLLQVKKCVNEGKKMAERGFYKNLKYEKRFRGALKERFLKLENCE